MNLTVLIVSFLVLLLLRCPVAFSMLLASFGYLVVVDRIPLMIIAGRITISLDSFPLLAVPFFIVAGSLMNRADIAQRIFDFAMSLFGHFKAGMAYVNIVASMIFAGMSGSAFADAAGLGQVEVKAMIKDGYDRDFSAAVTAVSSCIGPIIPPSVIMVLYGVMAEVSIGELFAAGMIPGVIMGISMMIIIWFMAWKGKITYRCREKQPKRMIVLKTKEAFFPLLGPVIILGAILSGLATPTEAGVVATVYALILGVAYKSLSLKDFSAVMEESVLTTGRVMFIIAAANLFGWLITIERVAMILFQTLLSVTGEPLIILFLITIVLLVLGCFIDGIAIMIISIPAVVPMVRSLSIDPVHFGVIMTIAIMIGLITPPMGMTLYIVSDVARTPVDRVVRQVIPFLIPLVFTLILTVLWEDMVLFLPSLLFG